MSTPDRLPYVEAELNYIVPMPERPRYYRYEPGRPATRRRTWSRASCDADPRMRPISHEIGLDNQGFALVEQRSAVRDFWDDDEVRQVYYPKPRRFNRRRHGRQPRLHLRPCQNAAGVDGVDLRQGRHAAPAGDRCMSITPPAPVPAGSVPTCSAMTRRVLRRQGAVINLWRPILPEPLRDSPLAVVTRAASISPIWCRPICVSRPGSARPIR